MQTIAQAYLFSGETLKQEGIARVTNRNLDWSAAAVTEIARLARFNEEITADDLRPFISEVGPPHHPNAIGAAFSAAAKQGLIKGMGFRKSTWATNHNRYVTVWRSNNYRGY